MKIEKNTAVTLRYTVSDTTGKLLEESKEPMSYLHGGYGNTFAKIEEALEGQQSLYQTTIELQPEDAFGLRDEALLQTIPKKQFPPGVKIGGQLEGRDDSGQSIVFTVLKAVLILVVVGFCFSSALGSWGNFATSVHPSPGGLEGFMIALIATLWAYDGWNDLTMVAGEVKRPERSLPIALIGGLFIVGFLFMATNAAIQYILPAAQIAASERPAVAALTVIAGPAGAGFVAAAMALSIFVTLNGTIMSGARIPYAAARDRLFFRQFAHINPRWQSPSTSLIIQALISTGLLVFLSRFQQFFELAVFAEWLFYMLTATTVFVYRRKRPDAVRPYKVWGYPLLPAIFIVCAGAVLVSSYASNLRGSLMGTALILLGLPVMWLVRRRYGASLPVEESYTAS